MATAASSSAFGYHLLPTIQTVAVIGGGSSGLAAARHLIEAGLEVTIFERDDEVGEAWTKTTTYDAPRPPSEAAFVPVARGRQGSRTYLDDGEDVDIEGKVDTHKNDISASSVTLSDFPFPPNTPTFIPRRAISAYIQGYASHFGVHPYVQLNTRVELVEKVRGAKGGEAWRVRLRHVERKGPIATETLWDQFFDAVVVATGNQQAPFVPPLPRLSLLPAIHHSTSYTPPTSYADVAILIVGAGQAALETAHKLAPFVRKIWISASKIEGPEARQAWRRLQRFVLPSNAEAVQLVDAFEGEGHVRLVDGRLLSQISEVVFATGYQYSFPFLPQYHSDPSSIPTKPSLYPPLVTNGSTVQHLHRNTFYIPDPTLAILSSAPTSTAASAEIQAMAVARVWTKRAALPTQAVMWETYGAMVEKDGHRWVNWWDEREFVVKIVDWLDTHAVLAGVEGVDEIQVKSEREKAMELFVGRYGLSKSQFGDIWDASENEAGSAREEMERKVRTAMMRRNGVY